ncbi:hypothetical protein P3X46_023332 [Hevea brasiliensis]|uniref:Fungal lipase-like domain-containing protein n=1 Tax=Hevea brasiliensis TaxID=3981 RepID=A0ABQ9LEA6_HEVBR|nr:protein EDS1 [Hevea brasiliensis]KAJ9163692.1 hypothetical protein P3X46_023332 [Hevea brasiliensis]
MAVFRPGESIGFREQVVMKLCSIDMKTHQSAGKLYVCEKIRNSSELVFSFPGSWSVSDWFIRSPFGEVKVDLELFPSLKHIGLNEIATVNEAFLNRFRAILANTQFKKEVRTAVTDGKPVVFTGHSLGGPIAILATIWFLEVYIRPDPNKVAPLCVTFGSPLVGDRIVSHALRRENWSRYFINFVLRYDIVPRVSLTPLSFVEQQLQRILNFFNPRSPFYMQENVGEASGFYVTVMRNALSVVSHAACKIMGSTNLLLDTLSNFVELSPYTPLGTYVFCTGNGKLVAIKNPDAVLQLLFYTSQSNSEAVALNSLKDHLNYKHELQECLKKQSVTCLDDNHLEALPLSNDVTVEINMVLNDLGLSTRARLCLRAAGELEKQKKSNQKAIDIKMEDIERGLGKLQGYKKRCQHKVGYYDAFKLSKDKEDFDANVKRLELAGIWDEIIEMLKRNELPDEFEGRKAWIEIGTRYRRLVEPLDIANYYRHLKNEDTGPYMVRGRPKRYKCTQRWREHAERMSNESLESCFWAEVEELCIKSGNPSIRETILQLKKRVEQQIRNGDLDDDVFLKGSTFDKLLKEHSLTNLDQNDIFRGSWS